MYVFSFLVIVVSIVNLELNIWKREYTHYCLVAYCEIFTVDSSGGKTEDRLAQYYYY